MKRVALAVLLLAACASGGGRGVAQSVEPTRVILIIGDGVGLGQWSLLGLTQGEQPAVSRLPHIGLVDTRCDCARTTDSGASATAYSIGERTRYRFVGVGSDSVPRRTVLEAAQERGMATGLVTTTHVTDATPASFAAHLPTRYDRFELARQIAAKNIDVLLGGGWTFFAQRPDGRNLAAELGDRYALVRTPAEFAALDVSRTRRLLGLFADTTTWDPPVPRPALPAMARTALEILDRDPEGFFLLLESEDTDDAFHDHLPPLEAVQSVRELDDVIAVALEYQQRRPETLIVVIGDHETGGFSPRILPGGEVGGGYTTTDHSATMVPVFAGGPGAERFGRWLMNYEVGRLLHRAVAGRVDGGGD